MHYRSSRRFAVGVSAVSAALLTAACRDTRVDKLSEGISRDSVLAIINEGATSDSLARVYRQETYLLPNLKGNVKVGNILFYNKKGIKEADEPKLPDAETTPIVLADGKVIGWGWTFYDSVAKASQFPPRTRQ